MTIALGLIALVAIFGLVILSLSQQSFSSNENQRQSHSEPADEQPRPEKRIIADEQQEASGWAKIKKSIESNEKIVTALSGVILAIFTVVLAFATAWLYFSSEKVAETALRQVRIMEREARPWIGVPSISDTIEFIHIFKNVGKMPTRGLFIDAVIVKGGGYDWHIAIEALCKKARAEVASTKPFGLRSLLPGDQIPTRLRDMPSIDGDVTIQRLQEIYKPHIAGCVIYGSTVDPSIIYKTGFLAPILIDGESVKIDYAMAIEAE